jgi:hypothetical protein
MAANKPTQLSSSLVVRKGQAAPAAGAATPKNAPDAAEDSLNAMTVKLDDERYLRLKSLGMRRPRRSSQTIMVAALDAYLEAEGA